jgi:hypothetical protein
VIERYLHSRIPLTGVMGVKVLAVDDTGVRLRAPIAPEWERFTESLRRRARARISLHAELRCDGELGGTYQGTYVADRDVGEAQ